MGNDYLREEARKKKALWRQFGKLPTTTIAGVVEAGGAGGGQSQGERLWSLLLQLVVWREIGGPLHHSPLSVTARVTDAELKKLMHRIKGDTIIAFRGKLAMETPFEIPHALFLERIQRPQDAELEEALVQYTRPVVLEDVQFGPLALNRRFHSLEGKATWAGRPVDLSVYATKPEDIAAALNTARALWAEMPIWQGRIDEYAIEKLLRPHNEAWSREDDPPPALTEADFLKTIELGSINVYADGRFTFWYDDGDLFGGHAITISGNLREGLTDVDTPG